MATPDRGRRTRATALITMPRAAATPFTPHEQISRMPMPLGASGTRIGDRAPRGGLEEVGRGAGEARHAQQHTTRRTGHVHDDHLDVFTVAGDRTCPQPRVPLPISIVPFSLA